MHIIFIDSSISDFWFLFFVFFFIFIGTKCGGVCICSISSQYVQAPTVKTQVPPAVRQSVPSTTLKGVTHTLNIKTEWSVTQHEAHRRVLVRFISGLFGYCRFWTLNHMLWFNVCMWMNERDNGRHLDKSLTYIELLDFNSIHLLLLLQFVLSLCECLFLLLPLRLLTKKKTKENVFQLLY